MLVELILCQRSRCLTDVACGSFAERDFNTWTAAQTVAWYRRRWWIESTFRDAKQHLGLTTVRVTTVVAFDRLLVA